jgi:hypothetical protein
MILQEILPKVQNLTRDDQVRLLQFLATEIAKDQGIMNNDHEEQQFWLKISETTLKEIWEDEDIYNELL